MTKQHTYILFIGLVTLFLSACERESYDFSYSPVNPHAGETVYFTNLSTNGEEWAWEFGDIATSAAKSPSHIYKKAGTYIVTMTADGKKSRRYSKEIVVYDTIPTIVVSTDSLRIFQEVMLKAVVYNPYSLSLKYDWQLPEAAVIRSGGLEGDSLTVFFTESGDAHISVKVTLGTETFEIDTMLSVYEAEASTLYMLTTDNKMWKQRLFELGKEEPEEVILEGLSSTHPTTILPIAGRLYILNGDATEGGNVQVVDLSSKTASNWISNSTSDASLGYYDGIEKDGYLYWTSSADGIHRLPLSSAPVDFGSSADYLFADGSMLTGLSVSESGGISWCSGLWLLGTEKGIYRFAEEDISSGSAPAAEIILSDYPIKKVASDLITKKIYFCSGEALYVSRFDGSYCRQIGTTTGRMIVSNKDNFIYYTTAEGVCRQPLMQVDENSTHFTPDTLNRLQQVAAIGLISR